MQNEILKPVLDSDEVAVPRYNIVGPDGKVLQQNVELRLQNEVVQEGTPYDEASVLPPELRDQLGLPQSATPAEAFSAMLKKSGGAVRRNRPPTSADAESVGKIWVVPEMTFRNMMPNAVTQSTGSWTPGAATISVSGNTVTATGNGGESTAQITATMNASVRVGDIVFTQLHVTVNHDANVVVAELTLGNQVLATKTLNVPAAGDTMMLQAHTAAEANGTPVLKVHSTYNTSAVQSGKGFTVKDITVWNLTGDMCEAQEGNEFTLTEAINYINSFGQFQTREYEYSTWWWVLRGVDAGQYFWHRMYDYATQAEAQGGTVDTKLMTPLKTQQFFTNRKATEAEVSAGSLDTKWLSPLTAHNQLWSPLVQAALKDTGLVRVAFKTSSGAAVAGIRVTYLLNGVSQTVLSGADGIAYCPVSPTVASTVLTFVQPLDVTLSTTSYTVSNIAIQSFMDTAVTCTIVSNLNNKVYSVSTSGTYGYFSRTVKTFDLWACGGGGSGSAVGGSWGGAGFSVPTGGGAGAYTVTAKSIANYGQDIVCTVGAGGAGVSASNGTSVVAGKAGGTSTVTLKQPGVADVVYSAAGGSGGTNNGTGADGGSGAGAVVSSNSNSGAVGTAGSNGSDGGSATYSGTTHQGGKGQGTNTYAFGETNQTLYCGAGGSALATYSTVTSAGGAGGGSASEGGSVSVTGIAPTAAGAGSGATSAANKSAGTATSAAGANGLILIRAHT